MSRRIQKVAALLKREVSELIYKTVAEECGIVTLTDVEVTADFKDAKIFISIMDQAHEKEILATLDEKTPEFQQILGRKLEMKFTPKIHFVVDHYQEKIDRIEKLLGEINHGS